MVKLGHSRRKIRLVSVSLTKRAHASEFGMQGYPNIRTVEAWQNHGDDSQLFPQSRVSVNHNKAVSVLSWRF